MGRASLLLTGAGIDVELSPIENHPDEAGLIGTRAARAVLDPGRPRRHPRRRHRRHQRARRHRRAQCRQARRASPRPMSGSASTGGTLDDKPNREEAIDRIADMLAKLIERAANEKMKLAPFMGIGCPGLIDEHGAILKGGQNLPGNWEGDGFNLAAALGKRLPRIDGHDASSDPQRRRRAGPERGSEHEGRRATGAS